jgi:hypothetical protein
MVFRKWASGRRISQMEIDCFICGEEMKYGISYETLDKIEKSYAFAICDIKEEHKTDKLEYIGFCKDCFQEVANIIVKNKFQQKNPTVPA